MATYNGANKYRPGWSDPTDVQRWIYDELCHGETLVFPKGTSTIGDTTADIDGELDPDVVADLSDPLETFSESEFDTVYCDPPYGMYAEDQQWVKDLWKVAKERLVLQTPRQRVTLNRAEKDWHVVEPKAGSPQTNVWLFQVFTKPWARIDEYE